MPDAAFSAADQIAAGHEEAGERHPAGPARMLPSASFGVRAAVLAGVIMVACPAAGLPGTHARTGPPALTTVSLGAAINGNAWTSCCTPH